MVKELYVKPLCVMSHWVESGGSGLCQAREEEGRSYECLESKGRRVLSPLRGGVLVAQEEEDDWWACRQKLAEQDNWVGGSSGPATTATACMQSFRLLGFMVLEL